MAHDPDAVREDGPESAAMVLYCLIRRVDDYGAARFLLMHKPNGLTLPPTKFRPGEDLYSALVRPLEEDLGLPPDSYFPERELPAIPNDAAGPQYAGLPPRWHLYPVDVSLTSGGWARLKALGESVSWLTMEEILAQVPEPNVQATMGSLPRVDPALGAPPSRPSMDALASRWAADNEGGVRVARESQVREILAAGTRRCGRYSPRERGRSTCAWPTHTCPTSDRARASPGASSRRVTNRMCMCTACRRSRSTA